MDEPKFGMQVPLNPISLDLETNTITQKILVESVENIDDAIVSEICKIAKEDGVNTLFVLDKKNIRTALERATAKKPVLFLSGYRNVKGCPTCGECVVDLHNYCARCGQKLDWEELKNES